MSEAGSQEEYATARECLNQRAWAIRRRLQEQNITGNGHLLQGRGPDAASAAGEVQVVKLGVWRMLVVGLAVVGGVVGMV